MKHSITAGGSSNVEVPVSLRADKVPHLDRRMSEAEFPTPSVATDPACDEVRERRSKLASALDGLDPDEEQAMAEEFLADWAEDWACSRP
jgi:hypothetical protein